MNLVERVEKLVTGANRGKKSNRCQVRENVQLVPSVGKHATGTKRGKTYNRCHARENLQPVLSAGKHTTGTKRGKTCDQYQARENVSSVSNLDCGTTHRILNFLEHRFSVSRIFNVFFKDWKQWIGFPFSVL